MDSNKRNTCYNMEAGAQQPTSLPNSIVKYERSYNVRLCGLEKLHPFDARKWGNVFEHLKSKIQLDEGCIFLPKEASKEELLIAHSERYLKSLKWGCNVAKIAEIPWLVFVPNAIIQRCYLRPMRFQTNELAHKVMIVDLDAHQGNGYAKDFKGNENIFIMDVYNKNIYPHDLEAKEAIRCKVELQHYTADYEYLDEVERNLERSLSSFYPDLIIYNAGTDILDGDPLGRLSITPKGVIKRDQIVFMKARERSVPIVMLTSGGYLKESAQVIADSIVNLYDLGLITKK
ncbi:hypothetical protein GE061_001186 [Apolygus lucorum]|uniref:Histone deacetylase domain-containing protein n=1 Tax=Apolygus lucorum TaxID=248454 RepID=A0A6A4KAJ1_APOLU|nr:hypothetical protein GE061_001186 [Apolygus lucorum]